MEDWTFITLFVMAGVVYLILLSLIGRRWMSGRLSARRAAIAAGSLTTLFPGLPAILVITRDGGSFLLALLVVAFLAGAVISSNAALLTYAGRHSVNDEMRRLLARQSQRED